MASPADPKGESSSAYGIRRPGWKATFTGSGLDASKRMKPSSSPEPSGGLLSSGTIPQLFGILPPLPLKFKVQNFLTSTPSGFITFLRQARSAERR